MKNRYEALLVLNAQGREETVKEIIDRLESEFQQEGAQIEQVQKMDKRQFSYASGPLNAGYYVNFVFFRRASVDCETALKIQARPRGLSPELSASPGKEGKTSKKDGESQVTWI